MSLSAFWNAWRNFWFYPVRPESVSLFRILMGFLVLQILCISIGADFLNWYGTHALVRNSTVQQFFWNASPKFDLLLAFPNDQSLQMYFYSVIVAAVCMMVGFWTRFSCIYVALALLSMHNHMPFNINGGDAFVRFMVMYLCFSNCGDCYSVDRWLAVRRNGGSLPIVAKPGWALRMIQIQLAIVYMHTFICKVNGDQWWDGTAVYFATRLEDLMRLQMPLYDSLLFCKLLSWYTLVVEFALFTLVWVKELRYYVLASALILHLGIDMAINLPVFEWAFIFTLVTFIDPEDLRTFFHLVETKFFGVKPAEHKSAVDSEAPTAEPT